MFRFHKNMLPPLKAIIIAFDDSSDFVDTVKSQIYGCDQIAAKEFSMNNAGWTRGAVSQLAQIQSQEQAAAVLRQLQQKPAQYNLGKDVTAKDAFAMVRPRSCQMPNELLEFAQHLADGDMAKIDEAYAKALDKKLSSASVAPVEPTPQPNPE